MNLGRLGIWSGHLGRMRAADARRAAVAIERAGYGALWIPEGLHLKEVVAHAGILLAATDHLAIAAGVANVWSRSPIAAASGGEVLGEAFPGRFVLGLGVSHPESMTPLGHENGSPLDLMERYLDEMEAARDRYLAPRADPPVPVLLGALGPRMLSLAARRTAGAHTYFVPVEHTGLARSIVGPGAFLAVEIGVVLQPDPARARALARSRMENPLSLGAYRRNLRRLGWSEDDLDGGGSDRLVDALVAHGDTGAVAKRVREHLDAGADHVALQIYTEPRDRFPTADAVDLAAVLVGS